MDVAVDTNKHTRILLKNGYQFAGTVPEVRPADIREDVWKEVASEDTETLVLIDDRKIHFLDIREIVAVTQW